MLHTAIFMGLAMMMVCQSGDTLSSSRGEADTLHLMLIVHANSVFDGVPRLPATGCLPNVGPL